MPNPQSVQSLLKVPGNPFDRLLKQAETLGKYNDKLQLLLPSSLKKQVFLLYCDSQQVVLGTTSAAQVTQLRFDADHLLTQLRQLPGLQEVQSLRFKIVAPPATSGKPLPPAKLSESAGQILNQAAEAFDDPDLKAAIKRLATRSKR